MLLVGDTPADVAVGLDNDVPVLAVASGRCSADELREAGATMVVASLEDPQALLRALGRALRSLGAVIGKRLRANGPVETCRKGV